ncbi:MAG: putative bifunctional diguanylate cyclase/phosphodiesterase [Microthrixaceae bacterium]
MAWRWYLVGGGLLSIAYAVLPAAQAKLIVWPAIGWSSVIAMGIGVHLHRASARGAWYLLIAGTATFVVGDNLYSVRTYVQHAEVTFPSFVDIPYLAMYPLLISGLLWLVRRRTPGRDRASLLDAAIITAGLGLLSWIAVIVPYVRSHDMSVLARLTAITYPLGDVVLLAIAVRLAVGAGRRPVAFWLLTGSIVPLLIADSLYGWMNLTGVWLEHNIVDAGWIMFYVGWGAAALHPSMAELSVNVGQSITVTARRAVLVSTAAFIPPGLLLFQEATGGVVDPTAIGLSAMVLVALVLVRTAGVAKEVADQRSETRFQTLVDNASDAIVVVDDVGRVRYQTPSAERVLGRTASELLDQPIGDLLSVHDRSQLQRMLATSVALTTVEWRIQFGDGTPRDLEVIAADLRGNPGIGGVVLTMRDVTERTALDGELRRRALHDLLTGLPNRALFEDRFVHALERAAHRGGEVAVLLLDLDDFQLINDSLGHAAGDDLLVAVATRLSSILKPGDTLARFGGDEFALLVEHGDVRRGAAAVAERVMDALREPLTLGSRRVPVGASVGIAVASGTTTPDRLLRDADLAMYVAKRNGKACVEWFAPEMHDQAALQFQVVSELKGAIEGDELVVHYQPIVEVSSGRAVGVEALVRWNHPQRGLLQPSEFIAVAERTGLVVPLGCWVLDQACLQVREWRLAGLVDEAFYVSVNLSARHFRDHRVIQDVVHAINRSALPASTLLIEITESALEADLDPDGRLVGALKAQGTRLAIDDFGTGYSSLGRLATFPIDVIKIDKSFIDQVAVDAAAETMVRSIVALTSALGLTAIAEGVEDQDQADTLIRLGCTLAQGYLFARPLPAADVTSLLDAQGRTRAVVPSTRSRS